jgi:Tfp pilus assembly protein PilE
MRAAAATEGGVSLVELLVAMALSALLIAGVADTVVHLLRVSILSNDRAELNERAAFLLRFFEALAADAQPSPMSASSGISAGAGSTCYVPQAAPTVGSSMSKLPADMLDCLGIVHARQGLHALVIDTGNEQWQRRLFYIRQHAWVPGDDLGALMVKQFVSDADGFGRAEMVLPGVLFWQIEQPDPSVLHIRLLLRGWRKDPRIATVEHAPLVRHWLAHLGYSERLAGVPLQGIAVTLAAPL